jgi:hypothetical protein
VTGIARRGHVSTRERELRGAVIERCRLPRCRRVTRLAVLTKVVRKVIWICRAVKVGTMTLIAA